jgi:hypothetical protein
MAMIEKIKAVYYYRYIRENLDPACIERLCQAGDSNSLTLLRFFSDSLNQRGRSLDCTCCLPNLFGIEHSPFVGLLHQKTLPLMAIAFIFLNLLPFL